MTTTEHRRTLHEATAEGLDLVEAELAKVAAGQGADPARAAQLAAAWREGPHDLQVEITVDKQTSGRIDTRSTRVHVTARAEGSVLRYLVVNELVRDLADESGAPLDARATARDLLAQLRGVPDTPAELAEQDPTTARWAAKRAEQATYLRCAIAALTPTHDGVRACCRGSDGRPLSTAHLAAHHLAEQWAQAAPHNRAAHRETLRLRLTELLADTTPPHLTGPEPDEAA